MVRIGVVATASRLAPGTEAAVQDIARGLFSPGEAEIVFHPSGNRAAGHFAGDDAARAEAFLDVANDPGFDALWFARGGYGSCRLLDRVMPGLNRTARNKTYLGYSDAGTLLGALYSAGFGGVAHGPMAQDALRPGGEAAVVRALNWLVRRDPEGLEPSDDGAPRAAFNLVILNHLLGTPWMPDLSGHVLMIEEVSEHLYRIDRDLWQLTSSPALKGLKGIRLGRVSDIPENDPPFGQTPEEIVRHWCDRAGVPFLGPADIGHDIGNRIVPFG
ncbi:LD-carboxypeptidase [Brevundimonas sp. 2R-24]|uniref:LD-carboxypeptidase n=1 Tax=Peiella sedimenti TaxID=3061083 RepID=A0ABT8SNK8_9CAUL|nr:LD-carboxypeptidase [Caulobacteraceae bacterium XZ-24]